MMAKEVAMEVEMECSPRDGDMQDAAPGHSSVELPDRFHFAYLSFALFGVGFLLPYQAYLLTLDYFQSLYPKYRIGTLFSVCYMYPNVLTLLLSVRYAHKLGFTLRIVSGFGLFAAICLIVPFLEYGGSTAGLVLTLASIASIGIADGLVQATVYGLAGLFSSTHTQAVMFGVRHRDLFDLLILASRLVFKNGLSGIIASAARITSKAAFSSSSSALRYSASAFFFFTSLFMIFCIVLFYVLKRTPVYKQRLSTIRASLKEEMEGGEPDAHGVEDHAGSGATDSSRAIVSIDALGETDCGTASGRVIEHGESNVGGKTHEEDDASPKESRERSGAISMIEDGGGDTWLEEEGENDIVELPESAGGWQLMGRIWPVAVPVYVCFFITLTLYPGMVSEVQSTTWELGDWMSVLLATAFNVADFVARTAPRWRWGGRDATLKVLWLISALRLLLIPLIVLCAYPVGNWFVGDPYIFAFTTVLGVTNGFCGTVSMMRSTELVKPFEREVVGAYMSFFLISGLTTGATLSLLLGVVVG